MLYCLVNIILALSLIAVKPAVARDVTKLGDAVEEATNKVLEEKEFYQQLVDNAKLAQEIRALEVANGHDQTIIEKIATNTQNIRSSKKSQDNLTVFVSFSMPQELLWSYNQQIKTYGGRMVIRGLVENSFKKTIEKVQIDKERILVLDIDPRLFKDYKVSQVPTIIIGDNKSFDKFTGSISLEYALSQAKEEGNTKSVALNLKQETK